MRILANILWFICGGFLSWLDWILTGLVLCITIIGIPWGVQCFKLAGLSLCPFGKTVTHDVGFTATFGNILWIILFGWELALLNLILGAILCVTIIGIPFGKQFFKIAAVSLMPFGAEVTVEHIL